MPYPNEHSARLRDPADFDPDSFRRTNGGTIYGSKVVPKTIAIIWGKLKGKSQEDDPPIPQALRFPTKYWTAEAAKQWLADNEIDYIAFEPARDLEEFQSSPKTGVFSHVQIGSDGRASVPAAACRFNVGSFSLGDNGENARSAPVRIVARTGQPIEHWYWGRVVHDLAGMHLHKARLPIDYCHDVKEVIGYLNHFDIASGDLVCSGALVPYRDNDRASEIIHKAKAGVPWEASIDFGGDGIEVEEVPVGKSAEVNGITFEGPGVIIRRWPLRGVAICPYGADANTSSEFAGNSDRQIAVNVQGSPARKKRERGPDQSQKNEETVMTDNNKPAEAEGRPAQVEEPQEAVEAQKKPPEVQDDQGQDNPEVRQQESLTVEGAEKQLQPQEEERKARQECERFIEAFGDLGGRWFAEGKTFAEAMELYLAELKVRNEQLRAEVDELRRQLAASRGEPQPVEFQPAEEPPQDKRRQELSRKIGPNLAAVAAGIRLDRDKE